LFIKIGQVMSSRPDFMPSIYIDHFSELQDNVPAYPTDDIKAIISTSLLNHHGLEFDQVFETFADDPLGSASIGQVHAATLTDNFMQLSDGYSGGKDVAVKVMHIDAQDRFRNDFKILKVNTILFHHSWIRY
jgi:predicted unusual protein kinase regulating ubiquinone biosynthesis (AarF/ABC1/UbiB family)